MTTHMKRWAGWLIVALVGSCGLMACGPTTTIVAPGGFVMLDEDQLPYGMAHKAISPDGALIVVRERDHEPEGSLEFWTEALEREITEGRGYELQDKSEVRAKGGYAGVRMSFKGAANQSVYRYDVAIFLVDDQIVTVETAALEASWDKHSGEFEAAIMSLRAN